MKKILFLFCVGPFFSFAQSNKPPVIQQLLQLAEQNYPSIKAKENQMFAAKENISIAKNSIVPDATAMYQANYTTYNNITSMIYTQYMPSITGPPSSSNNYSGVWGSAASLLLQWQAVTFGRRNATIALSGKQYEISQKDFANELFQLKIKVVDGYLNYLDARQTILIYKENLQRILTLLNQVKSLHAAGLKPGADTALLNTEKVKAEIELSNANTSGAVYKIRLLEQLGTDSAFIPDTDSLLSYLPAFQNQAINTTHPMIELFQSRLNLHEQLTKVIKSNLYPTLSGWGSLFARGSGVDYQGNVHSADGLSFSRYNYGIGAQLSVPLLKFSEVHKQLRQESFLIKTEEANLQEVQWTLQKQVAIADSTYQNVLTIAKTTPAYYQSAQFAYRTVSSRYSAGLVTYADLIQAEYQVINAAITVKNSNLEVWKALLYKAAVGGDINIFLTQIK